MTIGKVKWFNNAKGYGFILRDGSEEDLFAHFSSIQMEGYRTLKAGQNVEFEIAEGPKGLCAINIGPIDIEKSADSSPNDDSKTQDNVSVSVQSVDLDGDPNPVIKEMAIEDIPEEINEAG
ncbi:MAG: cold shock domain-containing protein CspD [Pseudomonadales bacterium]|nr:cold shock domain-containing protein CspD [Pseudomonadales bacterium]